MTVKEEPNVEQRRLELDERRLLSEERQKDAELELRKRELEARLAETQPARIFKISSISPTTIAAIIGIAATITGYLIQSNLNRELERERLQGQLVLKAIETGDPQKARANLRFFIETGLLSDSDGKVKVALDQTDKKPELVPVLPATQDRSLLSFSGVVVDESNTPIVGATVRIETDWTIAEFTTSADGSFSTGRIALQGSIGKPALILVTKDGYAPSNQFGFPGQPLKITLWKNR